MPERSILSDMFSSAETQELGSKLHLTGLDQRNRSLFVGTIALRVVDAKAQPQRKSSCMARFYFLLGVRVVLSKPH